MQILQVTASYYPAVRYGGPTYTTHSLARALVRRGHDVQVYTTNVDGLGQNKHDEYIANLDGVIVHYFPSPLPRIYWSYSMLKAFRDHIAEFDIVHAHGSFMYTSTAARRWATAARLPFVLSPRGMLVGDLIRSKNQFAKRIWIELFERQNVRAASIIHATSSLEAEEMQRLRLRGGRVVIIPNGIDRPEQEELRSIEARLMRMVGAFRPYILILGRINWKKGIDRLINAMVWVPQAKLVVAGNDEENYLPHLRSIAKQQDVFERVRFMGPVYGLDKAALMSGAELFVLPSQSENFGVVVLEAMAHGRPVITTREVGIAKTVQKTGAGIICEGTPQELGRAIASLLDDPAARKRMGEMGRIVANRQFSWDVIAEAMETAYQSCIKS